MEKTNKYTAIERAVRWLLVLLLVEFVLGATLTTVIGFDPNKHSGVQTGFLIGHIVIGFGLLVGAFVHILTARSARLLGPKPVVGFVCIVGAFVSGVMAARGGSDTAVFVMALFFGAAIVTYGLSYLAVKATASSS